MIDFKSIQFGFKSAEAERRRDSHLLDQGFYRKGDALQGLVYGDKYLVLGYKGTGKSAIATHIDLLGGSHSNLFTELLLLKDFPYEQVPLLVPESSNATIRTNLAWSLLLTLKLFASLTHDASLVRMDAELARVASELRKLGLLQRRRFRDLVLTSREINLSLALPGVFSTSLKESFREPVVVLSRVRDALRDIISQAETPNRHVLIIDGLDEIFTSFESNYPILASLVHEVDSLNADLAQANACSKVIVLCRTDIFERLPSPNMNKLRDYAVNLDWYHNPETPTQSTLFSLATHRARAAGYLGPNLIPDYFPEVLERELTRTTEGNDQRSKVSQPVRTYKFLLEHTRHTPRDFLQLLHYVQLECSKGQPPSESAIFNGLRHYSMDYFLPELKDELTGYFTPNEVDACFRLIGGLRRREFRVEDLIEYAKLTRMESEFDLREALRVLFECSAVGNIVKRPQPSGTHRYYTFRFRNRNASINFAEQLVLHRGAWKALDLT